jgi:hypothetical protein
VGNGVTQPLIQLSENDPNLCKLLNVNGLLKVGKFVIKFGNNKVLNLMSNSSGGEVLGTEKKINFENPSSCGCCSSKSDILPGNSDSVNIDRDRYFDFNDSRGPGGHHDFNCYALRTCSTKGHKDDRNCELWFGYKMFVDPNNPNISMSTLNAVSKGFKRKGDGSNGGARNIKKLHIRVSVHGCNFVNAWGYIGNSHIPLGYNGVGTFSYSKQYDNGNCIPSQPDQMWCNNIEKNSSDINYYIPAFGGADGVNHAFSIVFSNNCLKFDKADCFSRASFNKTKGPLVECSCDFYW